jgi:hypothetical protein
MPPIQDDQCDRFSFGATARAELRVVSGSAFPAGDTACTDPDFSERVLAVASGAGIAGTVSCSVGAVAIAVQGSSFSPRRSRRYRASRDPERDREFSSSVQIALERAENDRIEGRGDFRNDGAGKGDISVDDSVHRLVVTLASKESLRGDHLPEHDTQREDVGTVVHLLGQTLLW